MLIKIDRQEAINKFPTLPLRHYNPKEDEDVFYYPKVFANYILTLPSKSYKGHIKLLATQLVSLANNLGYDNFIFLCRGSWHTKHAFVQSSKTRILKGKIAKGLTRNLPSLRDLTHLFNPFLPTTNRNAIKSAYQTEPKI